MIKALFFDLDGTLLNSEKKIPLSAKMPSVPAGKRAYRYFWPAPGRQDSRKRWGGAMMSFPSLTAASTPTAAILKQPGKNGMPLLMQKR